MLLLCTLAHGARLALWQPWRTLRTRDARAISLWTQILLACGTVLWLVYGVQILSWPVIVANALTLLLVLAIITMKLRFG